MLSYKCDLCEDVVTEYKFHESMDMGFCLPCEEGPKCNAVDPDSASTCRQRLGHNNDHGQLFSRRWARDAK